MRLYPFVALFGLIAACGATDLNEVEPPLDGRVDSTPDGASPISGTTPDGAIDVVDARDASDAAPDGGLPATVTPGAADRILLIGTVVTPDVSFEGQMLVEGSLITCVAPALGCQGQVGAVGAVGATIIDTHGVIAPGLVDTHNHILFDIFYDSDWLPVQPCANATPGRPSRYQAVLDVRQCLEDALQGKPTWCPAAYDGVNCLKYEMDKWGELKGVIAGTTSIVASRAPPRRASNRSRAPSTRRRAGSARTRSRRARSSRPRGRRRTACARTSRP